MKRPKIDPQGFKRAFHEQLGPSPSAFRILEHLPDVMFFMKDRQGRITAATRNFAIQMGGTCEDDILGLDAFDLCPHQLAEKYTEDDARVMEKEEPLSRHLELVQRPDSKVEWCMTHKMPLYDRAGKVIGLAGISRSVSESQRFLRPFEEFSKVMDHIHENLSDKILIPELAEMMHISLNHFERKFRQVFGMSPSKYILHLRVHAAAKLLAETSKPISEISGLVGFYDQSALTRNFSSVIGITPSSYRKQRQ